MEKTPLKVYVRNVKSPDPDSLTVEGTATLKSIENAEYSSHSLRIIGEMIKDVSIELLNSLSALKQEPSDKYQLDEIEIRASIKFDGKLSIYFISGGTDMGGEIKFVFKNVGNNK